MDDKTRAATRMAFEQRYSDDSGVEFGVRLERTRLGETVVEFEAIETVEFPVAKLDWIIASLERIRAELRATPTTGRDET